MREKVGAARSSILVYSGIWLLVLIRHRWDLWSTRKYGVPKRVDSGSASFSTTSRFDPHYISLHLCSLHTNNSWATQVCIFLYTIDLSNVPPRRPVFLFFESAPGSSGRESLLKFLERTLKTRVQTAHSDSRLPVGFPEASTHQRPPSSW